MSLAIQAKSIASQFSHELGFVNRAALADAESKGWLECIPEVGFANFRHCRNGQTTIYEIAVSREHQKQGWGRLLFYRVLCSASEQGQNSICAKCPVDQSSNGFYQRLGFTLESVEHGRKRPLNCWRYPIQLPLLFFCNGGGKSEFDQIAKAHGWRLGMKSYEKNRSHEHMQMIDNPFDDPEQGKFRYVHAKHLAEVIKNKPLIATARDIMHPEDLPEVLQQARELAQYCGRVVFIPKCKVPLPVDLPHWLGYSIPTSYGGTKIECEWFGDRPVHLLGVSPTAQAHFARHLNTVSLDGNYAQKISQSGKTIWVGNDSGKKIVRGCYPAFAESLDRIKAYWHNRTEWKWEDEPLSSLPPLAELKERGVTVEVGAK